MNLEELISGLEKSAGFEEMIEAKKEKSEDGKKDDKKDDKKSEESKDDKKDDKKEEKDQEKSAAFKSGEQLAKEIMEKVASTNIQNIKGEDMNKKAEDAGKALASALLEKLASVGDVSTTNGIPDGVVPNKTQQDLAAQVAEHNMVIQNTPGTDGNGNGGTVNQIFDAIVADAEGKGVISKNQTASAPAEGAQSAVQAPNQVQIQTGLGDHQEKAAAVSVLVESGVNFDDAVNLVKAAAEEIEAEEQTQVKQAALNTLLENGVKFDLAVSLVKSASAKAAAPKVDIGAEKKAALDMLIENGVDFDSAVSLVAAKSNELYGS